MLVVPYNEVWPELYNADKELLSSVFKELIIDIHHFSSTAINGMSAKPIIDIMIVVEDIDQIDRYEVKENSPVYLTRNGRGEFAILRLEELDKLKSTIRLLEKLAEGEKSASEEGWISADDVEGMLGL